MHNLEQSCYNEDGRDYRGVASRTASKQECLPWNRQTALKTADHPELIGGHNYCRNPGGIEVQPWCYVAGSDGPRPRREFCSLSKCCKDKLKMKLKCRFRLLNIFWCFNSCGLRHQLAVHNHPGRRHRSSSHRHLHRLLRPPVETQSQKLVRDDQRPLRMRSAFAQRSRFQYGPFGRCRRPVWPANGNERFVAT